MAAQMRSWRNKNIEKSRAYLRQRYAENACGVRDKAKRIAREKYHADPTRDRAYQFKRKYGLTEEQVGAMLFMQECKCALCRTEFGVGRVETFAVDHDHRTGAVRGLLCAKCNKALGGFRDDASLLTRAADYITASGES
jgi:hypothetical protein